MIMEVIVVPIEDFHNSIVMMHPILSHKDFVRYIDADSELQKAAREIDFQKYLQKNGIANVHGFLEGKAVVIVDTK